MKLPGFLTPLGLKIAGVALLLVIFISFFGGNQIFSPGPLSAGSGTGVVRGGITSHADLSTNCAGCHTPPWSSQNMNDLCLNCHTEIQDAINDPTSLHGMLQAIDCRACHTEHRGPQGYLTQVEQREIDHNQFGFSLAAHETTFEGRLFECSDCHRKPDPFELTRCETCHRSEDERFTAIHVGEFGTNCRACHEGTDIFSEGRFDHNQLAFPLLGKHADVRCVDCHAGVTSYAAFREAPTDCAGCHLPDNPHPANFGTDCARCHNTEGWPTEIFDQNGGFQTHWSAYASGL